MRDMFDDDNGDGKSDFAALFEQSLNGVGKKLSVGDRIRGEILTIGKEEAFVSTGTMNDGVVLRKDLIDENGQIKHKVGDVLDLFVTQVKGGQIMLSTKPTAMNVSEDLEDAFDMMLPVEGKVTETCNGGFRVLLMGKTAFCPISQIDLRRVEDPQSYVGKKFEFMITQFGERGRNIVVSRRKLLEEQKELTVGSFLESHKPGDFVNGMITRLERFGAFVELAPGLEGLVHISELSWSRVNDPKDVVQPGQEVKVKILKFEENGSRVNVSLSLKQAEPEPWSNLPADIKVGSTFKGRVERKEPYGLFVRLNDLFTGLLPKSKVMAENASFSYDKVKVGDEITVQIQEVRPEERRISLGLPMDPDAEAWRGFAAAGSGKSAASLGTLGDQFKAMFESGQNQKKKS